MNLAFFTFNAMLFAGLAVWQWHLGRKHMALESLRLYMADVRDALAIEWERLIRAGDLVDKRAAMFGPDEVPDPDFDVDPSQRRWMVN
jgi:hypothetical protein